MVLIDDVFLRTQPQVVFYIVEKITKKNSPSIQKMPIYSNSLCYYFIKSKIRGEYMSEFEFPTNIRQIGSIGAGLKIYVEDYVCSYLQQYAANGGYEERLAFLIGRRMIIDNSEVLFISGAVQGKDTVENKGILTFGSMSFDYAEEQISKYFSSLEIVGSMQSQPGYGTFLNANYSSYHLETFKKPYQVLFIVDPIEKLNSFYFFDKTKGDLVESRGYFIYYEKNTGMHEYMLQNKADKINIFHKSGETDEDEEDGINPEAESGEEKQGRESLDVMDTPYFKRLRENTRSYANRFEKTPSDKKAYGQKRVVSLVSTLCAVLIMVCIVMGASLVQNDNRISSLEGQLVDLNTLYKNLLVQSRQSTQPVFASEEDVNENVTDANTGSSGEGEYQNEQARVITEDGNSMTDVSDSVTQTALVPQDAATDTQTASVEEIASEQTAIEQTNTSYDIPETYTVQEGDNLNYISLRFYGNKEMVEKIMEANEIDDPNTIYFGKVLILPRP